MALDDMLGIDADIYWVNKMGRQNLTVINLLDRKAAEKTFQSPN